MYMLHLPSLIAGVEVCGSEEREQESTSYSRHGFKLSGTHSSAVSSIAQCFCQPVDPTKRRKASRITDFVKIVKRPLTPTLTLQVTELPSALSARVHAVHARTCIDGILLPSIPAHVM